MRARLEAIQARDYTAFEATLTKGDRLTFIRWDANGLEQPRRAKR
jgi:hypothetical protein